MAAEDIQEQFQINKSIAILYRRYKDKMYYEEKQDTNSTNKTALVKNTSFRNKSISAKVKPGVIKRGIS